MSALPLLLVCGCANTTLVGPMKARGITHENTGKIIIVGSEADVGSHVRVEIPEQFIIQRVWDTIYLSRPYDRWYASGHRRIDFHRNDARASKVLMLYVNASGAAHIEGTARRYRCPGLDAYVMKLLEDATRTARAGSEPSRSTDAASPTEGRDEGQR